MYIYDINLFDLYEKYENINIILEALNDGYISFYDTFMNACIYNYIKIIKKLLIHKDFNEYENKLFDKGHPIIMALIFQNYEIVQFLINEKKDVLKSFQAYTTILLYTCMYGNKDIINILLQYPYFNFCRSNRFIDIAIVNNNLEVLDRLIEDGRIKSNLSNFDFDKYEDLIKKITEYKNIMIENKNLKIKPTKKNICQKYLLKFAHKIFSDSFHELYKQKHKYLQMCINDEIKHNLELQFKPYCGHEWYKQIEDIETINFFLKKV